VIWFTKISRIANTSSQDYSLRESSEMRGWIDFRFICNFEARNELMAFKYISSGRQEPVVSVH
jgi:hypothetical protein